MWSIGFEVEQETNAPPPKKNPGSAPDSNPPQICEARVFQSRLGALACYGL